MKKKYAWKLTSFTLNVENIKERTPVRRQDEEEKEAKMLFNLFYTAISRVD